MAAIIAAGGDTSGALTEQLTADVLQNAGYTILADGKYGANNGFDVVAVDAAGNCYLFDAKQMSSGAIALGQGAGGYTQLSQGWVQSVLSNLPANSSAANAVQSALNNNSLVTAVSAVDRNSGNLVLSQYQYLRSYAREVRS